MSKKTDVRLALDGMAGAFDALMASVRAARPRLKGSAPPISITSDTSAIEFLPADAPLSVETIESPEQNQTTIENGGGVLIPTEVHQATVVVDSSTSADAPAIMTAEQVAPEGAASAPHVDETAPALGSDWDFLINSDLGSDEDPAPASDPVVGGVLSSSMLNPDIITDNIQADQLPFVLEEVQELVPEIDRLLGLVSNSDKKTVAELHRKVHTLKGTVGQVGAMRARTVIHHMETVMEELDAGVGRIQDKRPVLQTMFEEAKGLIRELVTGEWQKQQGDSGTAPSAVQAPKTVRVNAAAVDSMVADINESRLAGVALEEGTQSFKAKLRDLDENGQRVFRMLRELELQAEMQIQSRRTQLQELGEEFDPLEFDRFTRLQELSRGMSEGINDILEVRRELTKVTAEQESVLAHQRRAIQSTQERLHKARLTPVDAINDRLYGVVWGAARELGKEIIFEMHGGRVELDRVLLEKIVTPLEHVLRNSIAHGVEAPAVRLLVGKAREGLIHIRVKQEAGRATIIVSDDGAGLQVEKIKAKAVEKGLWKPYDPMNDKQAAEMICASGFSTADAVSQIAGRGVGMDVVRSEVLALGGRFEIVSDPGRGLTITIQLPTSIASASVLVVEAGTESWAFPVEMVEHVTLLRKDALEAARTNKEFQSPMAEFSAWNGCVFHPLDELTGVRSAVAIQQESAPVLLVRERGRTMAIEVQRLVQVFEVPLRSLGSLWSGVRGVAGTVILPNGHAVFLVDPFRFTSTTSSVLEVPEQPQQHHVPVVMVVDDSLTVRKATARFLSRYGYEHVMAKDGQEALEILLRIQPSVILMDIEMPRMDGFDCTKNIRDNPKHKNVPIVMITSRTADRHRQHAKDLGVNEYLGKPFKDNELLEILSRYAPLNKPTSGSLQP